MQTKLLAAFVLCSSLAFSQTDAKTPHHKKLTKKRTTTVVAKPTQPAPAAPGLVVAVDPTTHQIRQPDASEIKALGDASAAAAKPAGAAVVQPLEIIGPGGARGMNLDDSTMSYAVATKTPDGGVAFQCVTGADKAKQALAAKPTAQKKGELDVQ